jgi:hypothetical protein
MIDTFKNNAAEIILKPKLALKTKRTDETELTLQIIVEEHDTELAISDKVRTENIDQQIV